MIEKTRMAGATKTEINTVFSQWSPSRESNKKYLVLLMERSCSIKTMIVVIKAKW